MTKYDIFNEPCKCNHRADEHIAGDGHCFKCNCPQFDSAVYVGMCRCEINNKPELVMVSSTQCPLHGNPIVR